MLSVALAALPAFDSGAGAAAPPDNAVPRFDLPRSGLELARHTESGKFFDVVGRRAAVFGYENRALEAWVYPLKLIDDFKLSFQLQGYPLEIDGAQIATGIAVRPEATTFTYAHAGFTVRQTIFAPLDEPGVVMLLEVDSVLPLTVIGSFRPRLKLMWPAGLMTNNRGWDEKEQVYSLTEETKRFVAGFRTSGESERPGFAWMFGRDALWTSLAIHSYGDFPAARTALEFLRKLQRDDGKIPHEISQSAGLIPWFTEYKYPWDSTDATPLYVVLQADHFRHTGDRDFLRASWDSIVKAWRFSAATDTDGNGLIENTKFGHGWTEGSPPYPPHEEIYLQGIWIEACRGLAELADAMGDAPLAGQARAAASRTQAAVEKTYWLDDRGFYAFATALAKPEKEYNAEPGPRRAARQAPSAALPRPPHLGQRPPPP